MNPLSNDRLAVIAQKFLMENNGFTLDEYGNSITGDLWAVSVEGKEQKYNYLPSLQLIENYLQASKWLCAERWPPAAYLGGWQDDDGTYYLDHTLVFKHKHTAAHEARRNSQKAIFHLGTRETFQIEVALTPAVTIT